MVNSLSNEHCFDNIALYVHENHLVTGNSKDIIRMIKDIDQLENLKIDFIFPVYCIDGISYFGDIGINLKDNGINIFYLKGLISDWFQNHDHKTRYTFVD